MLGTWGHTAEVALVDMYEFPAAVIVGLLCEYDPRSTRDNAWYGYTLSNN
jgi:hypothetical protein